MENNLIRNPTFLKYYDSKKTVGEKSTYNKAQNFTICYLFLLFSKFIQPFQPFTLPGKIILGKVLHLIVWDFSDQSSLGNLDYG